MNCAALSAGILESELFGHERGAFTNAHERKVGRFELADRGTLLLDEISEMDIRLQAKLLRAIQERVIDRVGGNQPVKVDIRVLATTNRDLQADIRAGRFREDLFYRLNVVTLQLPPLRERADDIPLLAEHFARKYARANDLPDRAIAEATRGRLMAHAWPGNIRELENTMHRAVLLASGDVIGPEAVVLSGSARPAESAAASTTLVAEGMRALVGRTVADVERDLIIDTRSHCLGNRTHAANILGISIRTLRNKLKQYSDDGLRVPPPRDGERLTA